MVARGFSIFALTCAVRTGVSWLWKRNPQDIGRARSARLLICPARWAGPLPRRTRERPPRSDTGRPSSRGSRLDSVGRHEGAAPRTGVVGIADQVAATTLEEKIPPRHVSISNPLPEMAGHVAYTPQQIKHAVGRLCRRLKFDQSATAAD